MLSNLTQWLYQTILKIIHRLKLAPSIIILFQVNNPGWPKGTTNTNIVKKSQSFKDATKKCGYFIERQLIGGLILRFEFDVLASR